MIPITDNNDIVRIWKDVFGDDEEFITSYINRFATPYNYILYRRSEGEAIGMVHYPTFNSAAGLKVDYLYALAVSENYRNAGVARTIVNKLLTTTESDIVVTIPDPQLLQAWYRAQFGFELQQLDVNILKNMDFDLGTGREVDDIFMVRVVNVERYLSAYAHANPKMNVTLRVIDRLDEKNNGLYQISTGKLNKTLHETSNIMVCDISDIYIKFPLAI